MCWKKKQGNASLKLCSYSNQFWFISTEKKRKKMLHDPLYCILFSPSVIALTLIDYFTLLLLLSTSVYKCYKTSRILLASPLKLCTPLLCRWISICLPICRLYAAVYTYVYVYIGYFVAIAATRLIVVLDYEEQFQRHLGRILLFYR